MDVGKGLQRHVCVQVFANDLNPSSYHWLQVNVKLNKVICSLHFI